MRVLISGYYGFGNLGDEGLLAGVIGQLRGLGHQPVVLSGDPAASRRMHGVEAVHRYRGLLPGLLGCQAVLSGGGGLLQDATSGRSLDYYLGVIRLARGLGRRTAVYGQSIGPLSSRGRSRVRGTLEGVPCAVRDSASIDLLAGLGLEAELVADPALLLQPESLPEQHVDVLLIPRAGYPDLTDGLLEAGGAAARKGLRVGLLAIQPGEDAAEMARLSAGLPRAQLLAAASHSEAVSACAGAGMVISARLHGVVFAVCAARPHAGLVYDPKVGGFLERSGGPAFDRPLVPGELAALLEDPPAFDAPAAEALRESARSGSEWLKGWLAA